MCHSKVIKSKNIIEFEDLEEELNKFYLIVKLTINDVLVDVSKIINKCVVLLINNDEHFVALCNNLAEYD